MAQMPMPQAGVEPVVHGSLALKVLLQQMEEGRKYSILDLGEPCGQNVDFWSQFPVKLYLPDLRRSLEFFADTPPDGPAPDRAAVEQLLPYEDECRFDIILGWDLFNYLEHDALGDLVRRLQVFCHPGTYLFVLISSLPRIPVVPTRFRIQDREHLIYDTPVSDTRSWPRYQPRDVTRLMAGFEVFASFLLRHGIQEYLFVSR